MAKKKLLLNESVTRRFMKLAEIKPTYVSTFLTEQEEEEELAAEPDMEEGEEDMEAMADEPEADMDMEDDMGEDEGGAAAAEDLVMKLLDKVQEFAQEEGVEMKIAGEDDEDMDMGDEEMDMEDDEGEANYGQANMDQANMGQANMYEARRNLRSANVSVINENEIINEVVSRVARRLLRESKRRK